ncbi:tetratricopeptide repeat protein 24 [Dicentrarchus labrax]|uniref:tetratricopeptide repeat protein 24 n=1 Tax=Dicentrarchus labrax TaxID=13489 RepID=UPI0021F59A1E|nr:tetratricopeptide repeat protein 24 [Dicentrarchus labrax]
MASDASPPGEEEVTVRRRRRRKDVQAVDIEELTSAGHRALQEGRTGDAVSCFNTALKTAGQLQDSRVLRACSFNLGAAYVEAGQPKKGLDLLRQAQPGPKADRLPDLQFNLALAHNALGQDREAAAFFLQAAQLYRSQGDGGSEGDACMEMGRCYSRLQDWTLAVQGFLRAAESYRIAAMLDSAADAFKEAGSHMIQSDQFSHDDIISALTECLSLMDGLTDLRILGELYLSVGVSYCRLRCFQEAVQCFQRALGPVAQQPPLLAAVLHNLGAALNSGGQFTAAVDYHRLAAGLYGSLGCRGDQARCFSNLAFACSQLGDEEEAAESFIHALQGFRDTGDHLAEVQVCESLAECYLRQRKQQKSVQLYKQALSALSHCQDSSGSVRDRLVERLTAALRQNLTVSLQRPHPLRSHQLRPHSLSPSVTRNSGITQSPGRASNQQPDDQRGEGQGSEATGRQDTAEHCGSPLGGTTEGPEYMSITPGLHSPYQSDPLQHSESPDTPDTSGTPGTPGTPHTPGTPDTPDTPGTPHTTDTTDTPDTSGTPDTPGTPGTPHTPGTTDTPGTPHTPGTTDTPDTPATPATPHTPGTPHTPHTPGTTDTNDTPGTPHTPGELWSDRQNPHTDSETSLVPEAEAPPTRPDGIIEATPPAARWRSRFCSLM